MANSEYQVAPFMVVCRTSGCENDGMPIQVLADPVVPWVTCGPCAERITDITPVAE